MVLQKNGNSLLTGAESRVTLKSFVQSSPGVPVQAIFYFANDLSRFVSSVQVPDRRFTPDRAYS